MDNSIEQKWRDAWKKRNIFEAKVDPSKKKFFVTVPWPYTNGSLHVGHGRTYTLGDIVARYKRMIGYDVLFPMAFHESGTPILAFSERIANKDKDTLKLYRNYLMEYEKAENIDDIIYSFREPKNIAEYFSKVIIKDFTDLGYSIDWSRKFTSADNFYQCVVRWQFNHLKELGLLKKGEYPILYSMNDENAVGEDDIKDGDTDKVSVEEFTGVLFKGKNFDLITASLRPETLFGVTNLWINPDADYVIINYENKDMAISYLGYIKFSLQHENVKFKKRINKEEILNETFKVPFYDRVISVYAADFVDPDNGTGIVYSVPGHSIFDYVYFKKNNLDFNIKKVVETGNDINVENLVKKYNLLNDSEKLKGATQELYKEEFYKGTLINSSKYTGLSVSEGRDMIKNDLLNEDKGIIFYETTRKAETRSGSKVIVAILKDQWFIDYSKVWLKEKAHDLINSMKFYPELYRKLMNDAIDWLRERPCARKRGIGTRLPFDDRWIIESLSDSTIYMITYTNANEMRTIYDRLGDIDDEILDYVYLNKNIDINKYDDKTRKNIIDAKEKFNYWYGNDLRITAPPHISNHLAFFIMNHAAIFKGKNLPGSLMLSGIVISNGSKISKSKGNVVSLLEITRRYSADLYRLFIAVGADVSSLLDWNEKDIASVSKRYDYFINILKDYKDSEENEDYIYEWFVSSFYNHLKEYLINMESMKIRDAYISIFYSVLNDFKTLENRGGNINSGLKMIMHDWLIAMSPVIPYSCEEFWHMYINDTFVSMEELDTNVEDKINYGILASEEYLGRVVEDIKEISRIIKNKGETAIITVYGEYQNDFIEMFNRKDIKPEYKIMIGDYIKNRNRILDKQINEYAVLSKNRSYIENATGLKIEILKSKEVKQKNPWPGRPTIKII